MRAACLYGGELRIEPRPEPEPGPGEVLVAVDHAGVCGSDLSADSYGLPDGFVLGHEISGEIVDVGRGVSAGRKGERVAVLPVIGCGQCGPCLTGDPTHCRGFRPIGIGVQGGFADLVVAGDRETFRLPDHLGHEGGVLVEPLAVGLHTVQRARLNGLERVLVVGGGPIGLAVTAWLAARHAPGIVVSEPVAARRDLALHCGAHAVVDPSREDVEAVFRSACGGRPAVVFECAGGRLGDAVRLAGRDGRIVVAGYHASPVPVDTQMALIKELEVVFTSWYTSAEFALTIATVARDGLPIEHLITHRISLEELPSAYAALKQPNDQGKVVIDLHASGGRSGHG